MKKKKKQLKLTLWNVLDCSNDTVFVRNKAKHFLCLPRIMLIKLEW